MWNLPNGERLSVIPRLYETEHTPLQDKLIYLHFFIGGCDWYVAEYDENDLFWGFVILNNDFLNAEWGLFSFSELKAIQISGFEIDCELESYWKVRNAFEVQKIKSICFREEAADAN